MLQPTADFEQYQDDDGTYDEFDEYAPDGPLPPALPSAELAAPATLQPASGFQHQHEPLLRQKTEELPPPLMNTGEGDSGEFAATSSGGYGPSGPGSPGLGNTIGSSQHDGIREDLDVSTEALIEETIDRLSFVHGVQGVIIIDRYGAVLRTSASMTPAAAARHAALVPPLLERARLCVDAVEKGGELSMLCVRTRKHEMLLCSEAAQKYSVLVLQDPSAEQSSAQPLLSG